MADGLFVPLPLSRHIPSSLSTEMPLWTRELKSVRVRAIALALDTVEESKKV